MPSPAMATLLRFSPAPAYLTNRDRTSLEAGRQRRRAADTPRWPAAQSHRDEHFGDVSVYFNQVEVPLLRTSPTRSTAPWW